LNELSDGKDLRKEERQRPQCECDAAGSETEARGGGQFIIKLLRGTEDGFIFQKRGIHRSTRSKEVEEKTGEGGVEAEKAASPGLDRYEGCWGGGRPKPRRAGGELLGQLRSQP